MDVTALLWIAAIALMTVGLVGTVLPALPGVAFVLAGIVLGAWIDDFVRVPVWVILLCALLAVVAWVSDYLATVLGARRAGASTLALIGAAVGTVVGLLMGLVGVLVMPFVGAVAGELIVRRQAPQAVKVGLATWIGLLVGTIVKFVLACTMIGLFVGALLV